MLGSLPKYADLLLRGATTWGLLSFQKFPRCNKALKAFCYVAKWGRTGFRLRARNGEVIGQLPPGMVEVNVVYPTLQGQNLWDETILKSLLHLH